ncbi:MAG: glycerophosphoryl diester phosphodiesterase membrane domain-containing protein [Pseudolysinimonas sp.]
MSDDQQWTAPGQAAVPPPVSPPVPPAAVPAVQPPPPTVAPGYGPPPPAHAPPPAGYAAPAAGWTPPPKPGLIPLRPMTLGTILGAAFQTLRRNPSATLAPALIVTLAVAVIQTLASVFFLSGYFNALGSISSGDSSQYDSVTSNLTSGFAGVLLTALLTGLLTLIATAIVQAIVTVQVASSTLGARQRLRGLWRRLRGRRGAVIGWAALVAAAGVLTLAIVGLGLVGIGLTGSVGVGIAVLLGLLLGAGLFVVFLWLWVKLGFVPAAIVLERTSIRVGMKRSWRLTNGAFWRILGIRLLVFVMVYIATQIIATPITFVVEIFATLLQPNGSPQSALTGTFVITTIVSGAVTAVISAVGLVIQTSTTALLYLDQRMRQEGLDLDLARFVERRAAGEQGPTDPYLPKPAT